MHPLGRLVLSLVAAAACLAAGLVWMAPGARRAVAASAAAETVPRIEMRELSERSVVYASDGSVLATFHAEENRAPVSLDAVPDHVVDAIVAVEDDSFWKHGGLNVRAMVRAGVTNLESGEVQQGGSTITQQVVKNSMLTPKRDVGRKVREAVLAVRLEEHYSKRDILEQYINTVYLGNGAYGLQAGAETYFGVDVSDLTVDQAALLAGIIRNPVGYDPFRRADLARARRAHALGRMAEVGIITDDEVVLLDAAPMPVRRHRTSASLDDYFLEEVKQQLLDDRSLGAKPQDRYNALFRGGLRIHTTLDPRLQRLAEDKVAAGLPETGGQFTAALVSVEPSTGAVRALVGGPGFENARYNLATGRGGSGRQPGSSFKPFVLLAALEAGFGPRDSVNGTSPCRFEMPPGQPEYEPGNYEGTKGSWTSVENALARSYNCAFVRMGLAIGLDKVAEMAQRMGIGGALDPVPAMALGTEEVTPLEMASAFGVLANDGLRREPYFVERVVDRDDDAIFESVASGRQVIDEQTARVATGLLRTVIERGTGTRARVDGREVAGKTGTSQNWENAWFVGYTPQLATAVWMGSPAGNVPMENVGGIRVTGGTYPARIWRAYMDGALAPWPVARFTAPDEGSLDGKGTIREPRPEKRRSKGGPRHEP